MVSLVLVQGFGSKFSFLVVVLAQMIDLFFGDKRIHGHRNKLRRVQHSIFVHVFPLGLFFTISDRKGLFGSWGKERKGKESVEENLIFVLFFSFLFPLKPNKRKIFSLPFFSFP